MLLTKHEGHTGGISAPGLDDTESVQQASFKELRPRANILGVRSRASLVNTRFIKSLERFFFKKEITIMGCKDTENFMRAILFESRISDTLSSRV